MRYSTRKRLRLGAGVVTGAMGIVAVLGFTSGTGGQHTVEKSPRVQPGEGMTAQELEEAARNGAPREYGGPVPVDEDGGLAGR